MKILMEASVGDALRRCVSEQRAALAPQLSCEAGGLDPDRARELLLRAVRAWGHDAVVAFLREGQGRKEQVRACLLDIVGLEEIIERAMKSEEVVSVADLSVVGGCAFDFSPDDGSNPARVELLLTSWGKHEAMAATIARDLGVETFRQRREPRLTR